MKILFLTLAGIDDRSFGGAMRSNDIRAALLESGEVDTLVIHGSKDFELDSQWSPARVKRATYNAFGASLRALRQRAAIRRWVRKVERESRYDVIVARYLGLALYVPGDAWSRLVLDADDLFKSPPSGTEKSVLVSAKLWLRNLIAGRAVRRARHVWVVNPLDGARLGATRHSWLGNAVHMPDEARARAEPVAGRILMVGYFMHPPNAEGLRWFASQVLPALAEAFPEVELHAIGKHPPGFQAEFGGRVKLRGFVDDLAIEYDRAALVIAPITSGGGSQIKVIEALAYGRPLVSSRFAHAPFAEQLLEGEHVFVAVDRSSWIETCLQVMRQPAAMTHVGRQGAVAVRSLYGVARMTTTVREVLSVLETKPL